MTTINYQDGLILNQKTTVEELDYDPSDILTGTGRITSDWGVLHLFQVADGLILALKDFRRMGNRITESLLMVMLAFQAR